MTPETRLVYMDHAATTPVDPRVVEAMLPYWGERFGNPSSIYRLAEGSRAALDWSRATVARILGATPAEIIFTSCGTESDNLALRGIAWARRAQSKSGTCNQIITSAIEHHAVGHTCQQLQQHYGFEVIYVPVDRFGLVDPDAVSRAIGERTALVSIMAANNEVGTLEPIAEIGRLARARGIPFHTDAVQAGGSLSLEVDNLVVDALSLSGHKFYAPKGVGVLYLRAGTPVLPTQTGGGQEHRLRAGTENVAYIVGLATALKLAHEQLGAEQARLSALRDRLIDGVLQSIPQATLTGHPTQRLPNNASFAFPGVEGEAILMQLDLAGIAASSGSACSSSEDGPSHVLRAMGLETSIARGSLRLTLGRGSTLEDVERVLGVLPDIIGRLRAISPLDSGRAPAVAHAREHVMR